MKMRALLAIAVLSLVLAAPHVVGAAVFDVAAGEVSLLITMINLANDETVNPGPDTINLESGIYSLPEPVDMTDGANGLPSITSEITINGAADTTTPTVVERAEGVPPFRIFRVAPGGVLTVNRLIIRGGLATLREEIPLSNTGGGILNGGTLTLANSTVGDNTANGRNVAELDGGGLENFGQATLLTSTVQFNTAGRFGGGINNFLGADVPPATLTLTDTIVNFNSAGHDGGGVENSATATITGGAISHNSAGLNGGGIANSNSTTTLMLTSTAVTANRANSGSGIENFNGATLIADRVIITENVEGVAGLVNGVGSTVTISNSILGKNANSNCTGILNSQGSNTVETPQDCTGFIGSDQVGPMEPPRPPCRSGLSLAIADLSCEGFRVYNSGDLSGEFGFAITYRIFNPVTMEFETVESPSGSGKKFIEACSEGISDVIPVEAKAPSECGGTPEGCLVSISVTGIAPPHVTARFENSISCP